VSNEDQLAFDAMFKGCTFGLRGGFEPREWHTVATIDYSVSLSGFLSSSSTNGDHGRHVFTIEAGTGSGKTQASGHVASHVLNQNHARWIIVVCPNRSILERTREVFRDNFGIHLDVFSKKSHRRGVGSLSHGYITTYQAILSDPSVHRKICGPEFLVVFDEVHHLGEKPGWGECAEEAFGRVRYMLCLTGTPYRCDGVKIPFVTYEETERNGILRFKADYTYSLGRAVADSVCRRPAFFYHDATVQIRPDDGSGIRIVTFEDTIKDDFLASVRLRGAVAHGSEDRKKMLASSLAKIKEAGRKVIIFLGGDTDSDLTPSEDAKYFLPAEIDELGYPGSYVVVTGDDASARAKIRNFGSGPEWIMIAINMVSEGVDKPEFSSAIFLTSITAKQTTLQRMGRPLRLRGADDPFKEAWIFLFRDRYLYEISDEIEATIDNEVKLAKARQKATEGDGTDQEKRYRTEAIGIGDGRLIEIKFGGESYSPEEFEAVRQELRDLNQPTSYIHEFLELKMRRTHVVR
jgi:superfamily II DNA or RNA helicase